MLGKGVIVPINTPMHEDESLNLTVYKEQIDRQVDAGIHGVFCLGTNGEFYVLSEEEKLAVMEATVKHTAGRVPVYAGTGCASTQDTIRLSKQAKELGVDALSIITPYFAAASQEEIVWHFTMVAEAVDLPIILYNMPARTGNAISPASAEKLSHVSNIIGIKDSSGNFDNMKQYIELTAERGFKVLSGNDSLILWNLLAGGSGGIAGCANVYPKTLASIYDTFVEGNLEKAMAIQDSIRPLRNCFKYGNPNTIVKAATAMQGVQVGKCRSPFNRLTQEALTAIGEVLTADKARGLA